MSLGSLERRLPESVSQGFRDGKGRLGFTREARHLAPTEVHKALLNSSQSGASGPEEVTLGRNFYYGGVCSEGGW